MILGVALSTTLDNDTPDVLHWGYSSIIREGKVADKEFKTYNEQRKILTDRGLLIAHPIRFVHIMQNDDYYNIINGYKKYFIASMNPEKYFKGTTFEQVYALYLFDQELRSLFMECLLRIEKKLKSLIAYHFSEAHGYDHRVYLDTKHFNNTSLKNQKHASKMISKVSNDISYFSSKGNNAISHYMSKYSYIPLWVLNTVLSFGRVAHFYSCMQLFDQQKVSQHFNISASELSGFMYFLDDLRNVCAHGGRIYTPNNVASYLKFIPDVSHHKALNIPRNPSGNYIYGKSDTMAALIAFKIFLKKSDFTKTKKTFLLKETALSRQLPESIMLNIEKEMGFPQKYLPNL